MNISPRTLGVPVGHRGRTGVVCAIRRYRRTTSVEVVRPEAAEHVGDFDHDRLLQRPVIRRSSKPCSVVRGCNRRRRDAGVAKQDLHDAGVDPVLDQSRGVARMAPPRAECLLLRQPRRVYTAAVAMGSPHAAEFVENGLRQRHQPHGGLPRLMLREAVPSNVNICDSYRQ